MPARTLPSPTVAPAVATSDDGSTSVRELLTADEVAEMVGMGVDWIYAETRKGRIPHIKLGRCRRYRLEAIRAWLAALEERLNPTGAVAKIPTGTAAAEDAMARRTRARGASTKSTAT